MYAYRSEQCSGVIDYDVFIGQKRVWRKRYVLTGDTAFDEQQKRECEAQQKAECERLTRETT